MSEHKIDGMPDKYIEKIKLMDNSLQGQHIKPSNLIPIILLALEIYENRKDA